MLNLYRHQKIALANLRINDSFALFMEQGTGKTIPTLMRIQELVMSRRAMNCLVVCPKAVMGSWERDIEKFPEESKKLLQKVVTVINYDMVWRREEYVCGVWDIIVLDESHKVKNHTTRRSKALLKMSLSAKYRYILTGTPINNGQLENIWSQFAFLDPYLCRGRVYSTIFKGSYYDFLDRFAFLNQYHQPYRYRYVDELQEIINDHSYRVTKAECLDLPEKLPDEIYDIELKEKKRYKELFNESTLEEFEVLAVNPLSRLVKLRQLCSGWINDGTQDVEVECEKEAALEDFLDGWEKKLVIFCEFRNSIDRVSRLLKMLNINHVILDGRTKDKSVWKDFQNRPEIQVIVCQYQSANAGIDLYAADTMLFYEPTLSSNVLEQAKDRIHRIGQDHKCSYIHFLTKGTVEKAIYSALKNYRDFSEKLFEEYIAEYQKGWKA